MDSRTQSFTSRSTLAAKSIRCPRSTTRRGRLEGVKPTGAFEELNGRANEPESSQELWHLSAGGLVFSGRHCSSGGTEDLHGNLSTRRLQKTKHRIFGTSFKQAN